MDIRWSWLVLGFMVLTVVVADDAEDGIPDAGVDSDEDSGETVSLDEEESRNLRPRAYTPSAYQANTLPGSGFRPTASLAELAGYQTRQEQPQHENYVNLQPTRPVQQYVEQEQRQPARTAHRKFQEARPSKLQQLQDEEELEEKEKEEPDRLALLLQQSKFDCSNKQSGYYADEELNCEVFHYCQDSVKHSWICPDGFTFHQVHLICMPPNHDNICQKSSKYHFVNEYLYRPINEEEVQRKPNVSLRYSDRYYPAEVYRDDRYEEEDEEEEVPRRQQQQIRVDARPSPRPQHQQHAAQAQQVFRSAEDVNIPLVQRRPQRPFDFDF